VILEIRIVPVEEAGSGVIKKDVNGNVTGE
jgi:hypothetical protein